MAFTKPFYSSDEGDNDQPGYRSVEEQNAPPIKKAANKALFSRLLQGLNYMDANYPSNLTIDEICKKCYISKFHFSRSFKDAFAVTPYQYLLHLRLTHALELIKTNEKMSLTEVSAACGFIDLYTFSKAFKRKYQVAPSYFRKKGAPLPGQNIYSHPKEQL